MGGRIELRYGYMQRQLYLGAEVAYIDSTPYLLNLGGVNITGEGRRLGHHSTHHRDEWLGNGSSGSIVGCSS